MFLNIKLYHFSWFINFVCMGFFAYTSKICTPCVYLVLIEVRSGFLGIGVTDGVSLHMGVENGTWVLYKNSWCFQLLTHLTCYNIIENEELFAPDRHSLEFSLNKLEECRMVCMLLSTCCHNCLGCFQMHHFS